VSKNNVVFIILPFILTTITFSMENNNLEKMTKEENYNAIIRDFFPGRKERLILMPEKNFSSHTRLEMACHSDLRSFAERNLEQMKQIESRDPEKLNILVHHLQPKKNMTPINDDAAQQIVDECPICFEDINDIKNVTLQCTHRFHVDCINKWEETKSECPLCRGQIVFPDVSDVTRETEKNPLRGLFPIFTPVTLRRNK